MRENAFFKAAVFTALIFTTGILVGIWLDTLRIGEVREILSQTEIDMNDIRAQGSFYELLLDSKEYCNSALKANLDFNNKTYEQGAKIEQYEAANRFDPNLDFEEKKYVLLQLQFWINSINIRKSCNANYSTMVYFHAKTDDEVTNIQQRALGMLLSEIKEKCGTKLMFIPLLSNINITTVDMVMTNFGIESAPAILINEKVVLEGLHTKEEILKYLDC